MCPPRADVWRGGNWSVWCTHTRAHMHTLKYWWEKSEPHSGRVCVEGHVHWQGGGLGLRINLGTEQKRTERSRNLRKLKWLEWLIWVPIPSPPLSWPIGVWWVETEMLPIQTSLRYWNEIRCSINYEWGKKPETKKRVLKTSERAMSGLFISDILVGTSWVVVAGKWSLAGEGSGMEHMGVQWPRRSRKPGIVESSRGKHHRIWKGKESSRGFDETNYVYSIIHCPWYIIRYPLSITQNPL